MIFLFYKGLPHIKTENLLTFNLEYFFLPYGVVLFSMTGMSVIPEVREILANNAKKLRSVIILGSLIPMITYILFIILVLGISGEGTTTDGLTGLQSTLGDKVIAFGYLFGIISTFTSYLTLGLTLKKIYWYDLKLPHLPSWALASFVPLVLYALGVNNFIAIIGFTGAVTAGIDGILMFIVYLKARKNGQRKPEYKINLPKIAIYLMGGLFLVGVFLGILPV
jgi:tyrosine-specific transport protein